jgi:hypothetical protein
MLWLRLRVVEVKCADGEAWQILYQTIAIPFFPQMTTNHTKIEDQLILSLKMPRSDKSSINLSSVFIITSRIQTKLTL